jgi:hypothetical protein
VTPTAPDPAAARPDGNAAARDPGRGHIGLPDRGDGDDAWSRDVRIKEL